MATALRELWRFSSDYSRKEPKTRLMAHSLTAKRATSLQGNIEVPGDKSISHRALILGALANGRTAIDGLLEAEDVLATARVVSQLGAEVSKVDDQWIVLGRGVGGLGLDDGGNSGDTLALDFGNSGTSARLLMGVIAGHEITATLDGDASLRKRPMGRVIKPLIEMGLQISDASAADTGYRLPLDVRGTGNLLPIEYRLPVASAQVKSAILLAGLHAAGETRVMEPTHTRDHTERMLRHMGGHVSVEDGPEGRLISLDGRQELTGRPITVPGDPSSAAFPIAAALMVPGSQITVRNVLCNPLRTGLFQTLIEMGADIRFENEIEMAGEEVADISASYFPLKGVEVPASRAASMIDEYPILSVIASMAEGETIMRGLDELRVKESDRLASTLAGLKASGIEARIDGDDLIVSGAASVPGGGMIATEMDHRIAMSFLVLGLVSEKPVIIDDRRMIATSFPEFETLMGDLGAEFIPG